MIADLKLQETTTYWEHIVYKDRQWFQEDKCKGPYDL
jgi:hypothetical protein